MLYNTLRKFRKSESGGVIIIVTLSILVLFVAAGIAFDMARTEMAKVKLSSCLDTAGVAALAKVPDCLGSNSTSVNACVVANVQKYFLADCQSGYLQTAGVRFNGQNQNNNVSVVLSPDDMTLTLNALVAQKTDLMSVVGVDTVNIAATTVVTRQTAGMELALVLDNTGSMGVSIDPSGVTKITALKCAVAGNAAFGGGNQCSGQVTTGLLDLLYGNNNTVSNMFVSVIPFTAMINPNVVAAPASGFVNNVTLQNSSQMTGCIDSRDMTVVSTTYPGLTPQGDHIHLDISDDPPVGTTAFKALSRSVESDCIPSPTHAMLTNKSDVISVIRQMTADGNTMLPIGLAWGWRALSPNWKGFWGASPTFKDASGNISALPLPYQTAGMNKVVIFMTDGMNDTEGGATSTDYDASVTAYADQASRPSDVQLDRMTGDVCDAMKAKGIIIYTIAFGRAGSLTQTTFPYSPINNSDRDTGLDEALLAYCAAGQGTQQHFFPAANNAALADAFQQIGNQLSNLLITK